MINNPIISIIVPTYNVAPYIRKCLESVASQTYNGHMECLIVDDCGQDNSIHIAEEFINGYKGPIDFRIIHREKNGGLSAARNTGICEAKGEYLYFLDSDDWIIPECIELMVECLRKYPEAEVVQAGARVEGKGFKWMDFEKKKLPEYSYDQEWIKKAFCARTFLNMTAWNKLLKRSFVLDNNLFFEEGVIHEDEILNIQLAIYTTKLAICSRNTYVYFCRDSSIMGQRHNQETDIERRLKCWKRMLQIIEGKKDNVLVCSLYAFVNQSYWFIDTVSSPVYAQLKNFMKRIAKQGTGLKRLYMYLWAIAPYFLRTRLFAYRFIINKTTYPSWPHQNSQL